MHFSRPLVLVPFFAALLSAAPNQPVTPRIYLELNDGSFCPNGTRIPLIPTAGDPPQLNIFGSFCNGTDKPTALVKTSSFFAPKFFRLYTIGWSKAPAFSLERISDAAKFQLVPINEDQRHWSSTDYKLPIDWQGQQVRIVAEGAAPGGLWRAFGEPLEISGLVPMKDAAHILGLTLLHYAALMLCAMALTAFAVLGGVRDRIQAGIITLAATAVPGYLVFWLTLWTPKLNRYYAMTCLIAALLGLIFCLWKLDPAGRAILRSLATPLLLTGATALMVLSSGFLYGGLDDPLNEAQGRFLPRLPPDNELPLLLALGVRLPKVPTPLQGNWLSSDRPPLQSGIVLAHYPILSKPRERGYTVVSVLAQSLWIFGLWLLLTVLEINPRALALCLAACLFSGFVFLNMFFVWPKLLAAAYAFGFLAAFVAKPPKQSSWVAPGALLAFSLLAHGGAIFALVPAVPLILLWKRPIPIQRMAAVLLFGVIVYAPWMAYQKFYDPPGNRLMKIHLAGVEPVDKRSFSETLNTAYANLTPLQIFQNKKQNLEFSFGEGFLGLQRTAALISNLFTPGHLPQAAHRGLQLREQIFFHPAVCLGLFIFAPCALLAGVVKRFRTTEWKIACLLWLFTFAATAFWCVAMFGPSTTSIHQGAYATMLLAMAAGVLSLWAVSPYLAVTITLFQIALNFVLNEYLIRIPYNGGILPRGLMHPATLALLCLSTSMVVGLLATLSKGSPALKEV